AAEHAWPQAPQFATSAPVAVSQPSVSLSPLQSLKPAAQAPLHWPPPPHVTVAMWFDEHAIPQPPQFAASVEVWTSQPFPTAASQWAPAGPTAPSHPSVRRPPPQSAKPGAHGLVHAPPTQVGAVTFRDEHPNCTPHPPQFAASPFTLISQPLVTSVSQSAKPG